MYLNVFLSYLNKSPTKKFQGTAKLGGWGGGAGVVTAGPLKNT